MLSPDFKTVQNIKDTISNIPARGIGDGVGIIMDYNPDNHNATVQMADKDSWGMGTIVKNVYCPLFLGVQPVAPENGRPVWVAFHGGREGIAVILCYFNFFFADFDQAKQNHTTQSTPRYLLSM